MIYKILFPLLLISASVTRADFDDAVTWRHYFSEARNDTGGLAAARENLHSTFLHSNIHRIDSYNWNFLNASYDPGRLGLGFEFSSVGLKDYYQRNKYRTRLSYDLDDHITLTPRIEIATEEFSGSDRYTGMSAELSATYSHGKYNAGVGFSDIELKRPYDKTGRENSLPYIFGSWIFEKGLVFSVGVRRFENRRTRWIFDQDIYVNDKLTLYFGYINRPSDIYGSLRFKIVKFSLIVTYSSVSGLNDSVIWGISYGD